jgi:hypothetical protein
MEDQMSKFKHTTPVLFKTTHGEARPSTRTAEYRTWSHIITRCHCPTSDVYHRYGGRGIYVCDRWLHSYEAFLEDMGRKPTPLHTIERIDNDGPYCKENCRWATNKEQAQNKRTTLWITFNGETKRMTEWIAIIGLKRPTVQKRMRMGWSIERTFTTPIDPSYRRERKKKG